MNRPRILPIVTASITALAVALVLATAAPAPAHAAMRTVASYQMNEGSDTDVMHDSSGFGLDGTIGPDIVTGAAHAGSTGFRWPYAAPDTSPLRPERLAVVGTHQHLNPGSADFAIEIRYRADRGDGNIVQKGQSQTQGGYWKLEHNNGRPTCLFRRTQRDQAAVTGPTSLADGDWHTVRCVRSAGDVAMYIDGGTQPVDRRRVSVGAIANGFELTIGGKSACNQRNVGCDYFSGDIDYVRIDKDVPAGSNQDPVVDFTTDCTGPTCTFDSTPSHDPDGDIVDHRWDFGDGTDNETQAAETTHTFPTGGSYTVSYTGTDDDGASATSKRTVDVDGTTSKFVPLPPTRLFDTRPAESPAGYKGIVHGGTELSVQVADRAGVPSTGVTAVAINLTGVGVQVPSYVAASPTESIRATTSSLNLVTPGQVRANLVVVPVGDDGTISLFTLRDAHLIGDVAGYFTPQASASDDGRIVTRSPRRLFDSRVASDLGPAHRIPADGTVTADVLGRAGVPTDGVEAVVMNVTATDPDGAGFVTIWPDGDRPAASSLNMNGAGEIVANQVIVPVGPDGRVRFSSSVGVDLVADVLGWVTSDEAPSGTSGLFVPLQPARIFDTRPDEPAPGPKGLVGDGATIRPQIGGVAGVPDGAAGVVLNVTMIGTGPGYATLWPSGAARPTTSNVNVDHDGDVRPNGTIVGLGDGGHLDVFVLTRAHVLADVAGYLLP